VALPLSDVQMDMAIALAYRPDRMSTACENFIDLMLAHFEQDGGPAGSAGSSALVAGGAGSAATERTTPRLQLRSAPSRAETA